MTLTGTVCWTTIIGIATLIGFTATVKVNSLSDLSYAERDKKKEIVNSVSWDPPTPSALIPDYRLLHSCEDAAFSQFSFHLSGLVSKLHESKLFEWTSISVTTLGALNRTYLLLGGSARKASQSSSQLPVTPRDGGSVILCEFEVKRDQTSLMGFGPTDKMCYRLSTTDSGDSGHESLGSSTAAVGISPDFSVLAYCDPLWRAKSSVPVGRCFLNVLHEGQVKLPLEFSEFCQTGLQMATPCMAGHSLALAVSNENRARMSNQLKNIQLWVGQPLSRPNGRAQIVNDPYGAAQFVSVLPPDYNTVIQIGSQFGYALTNGFVTAPAAFDFDKNGDISIVPVLGIQAITSAADQSLTFGSVDWLGSITPRESMSSVGISVLRVDFGRSRDIGVVLGAPYHDISVASTNNKDDLTNSEEFVNRGRIYLYCVGSKRHSATVDTKQPELYEDFLDGPLGSTFFGFALTALGDVDGDGYEEIAVGAPDLSNRRGFGRIYIIRLLSNCSFDQTPIQIIDGPLNAIDFGAHLPSKSEDMDFNGLPDLAIPSTVREQNIVSTVHLYFTRIKVQADCRFSIPPWLTVRKILAGDILPIQLVVFLKDFQTQSISHSSVMQIFEDEDSARLFHQIDSDLNISEPNSKRFRLYDNIRSQTDWNQRSLVIDFDLVAQHDVQDMSDIETGLFIGYRFLQPCFGTGVTVDENGTCAGGGSVRRPLIDWSKCVTRVPLSRFVCYPNPTCESDVSVIVTLPTDRQAQPPDPKSPTFKDVSNNTVRMLHSVLIFGKAEGSRPEFVIEVLNRGPTFAGGVWLELQFGGNLRFSQLIAYEGMENFNEAREIKLKTLIAANETWVACYLGNLPSPNLEETDFEAGNSTVWYFKVVTYYSQFMNYDEQTFTNGASVTVSAIPGTPDPQMENNRVHVNYSVVHDPKIRVSYGPRSISSRMDNRTRPVPWFVDSQRRMDVNELGPRLEHTMQIEYLGPTSRLHNVTIRATIPSELSPTDYGSHPDPYLVYFFHEIRASLEGDGGVLRWVDVAPKLTLRHDVVHDVPPGAGTCAIMNAESVVNPKNLVGMDIKRTYSRTRRHAIFTAKSHEPHNKASTTWDAATAEEAVQDTDVAPATGSSSASMFRRIPKEILQCDRVGYRLAKPVCAQIVCRLDELQRNRPVLFTVTGWLWSRTLFDKRISDVDLVTTLTVDQGDIPVGVVPAVEPVGHFHLMQTFFFPQIRPKLLHQIPTWPIIVGVVLGILFLSLLIILLYLLGFFKRRKSELRKARYSKGGADELERDVQEQMEPQYAGFGAPASTDRYDRTKRKQRRGRHRAELTILHPADLAASHQRDRETEKLLEDSLNNGNNGQVNVGSNGDG